MASWILMRIYFKFTKCLIRKRIYVLSTSLKLKRLGAVKFVPLLFLRHVINYSEYPVNHVPFNMKKKTFERDFAIRGAAIMIHFIKSRKLTPQWNFDFLHCSGCTSRTKWKKKLLFEIKNQTIEKEYDFQMKFSLNSFHDWNIKEQTN